MALWDAYWKFEPWGDGYFRDALINQRIDCMTSMYAAKGGQKYDIQDLSHYMPQDWAFKNPEPQGKSGDLNSAHRKAAHRFPTADHKDT